MTGYECTWNGCLPVYIEAEDEQAAREEFARAAQERGNKGVKANQVQVSEA